MEHFKSMPLDNEELEALFYDLPQAYNGRFGANQEYRMYIDQYTESILAMKEALSSEQFQMVEELLALLGRQYEFECMHFFELGWLYRENTGGDIPRV